MDLIEIVGLTLAGLGALVALVAPVADMIHQRILARREEREPIDWSPEWNLEERWVSEAAIVAELDLSELRREVVQRMLACQEKDARIRELEMELAGTRDALQRTVRAKRRHWRTILRLRAVSA